MTECIDANALKAKTVIELKKCRLKNIILNRKHMLGIGRRQTQPSTQAKRPTRIHYERRRD